MVWMACAASCTSDRHSQDSQAKEEMTFEVGNLTRAIITTDKNLKNRPFRLFGDVNRTGEYYPGLKPIFRGDIVRYDANVKKWDYGSPIYWLMGQEHSFVALHPAYIQEIPGEITYSDSRISFTYETPLDDNNEYKESTDIIVAAHRRRKYTLDATGPVQFQFKHILSRIDVAPALAETLMYDNETNRDKYPYNKDEYIQIAKVEIHGLKTRAVFSFASVPLQPGQFQTDGIAETYEVDNNSVKDIILTFNDTKKVTNNNENVPVFDDNNALLVLPQKIGSNVEIVLYYTVNGDHTVGAPIRTATIPLSNLINELEVGKIYTYRFSIQKAYTGQIKPGSLRWTVEDSNITDPAAKEKWISKGDTIRQRFDKDE